MKYSSAIHFCFPLTLIIAFKHNRVASPTLLLEKQTNKIENTQKGEATLGAASYFILVKKKKKIHHTTYTNPVAETFYIIHKFFYWPMKANSSLILLLTSVSLSFYLYSLATYDCD